MQKLAFKCSSLALFMLASCLSALGQESDRIQNWREDFTTLSTTLSRHQADFRKLYPNLAADLASLLLRAPGMSDAEVSLEVMRLTAGAGVAHNRAVVPFSIDLHRLPLEFHWYADGLAVIAASPAYSPALGARVLRIGSMAPEQMLAAITPWVAHENDPGLRQFCTEEMRSLDLLRAAGVVQTNASVDLTLARPGKEPFILTVQASGDDKGMKSFADWWGLPDKILSRRHPDSAYWYEYLEPQQAIYIQYNQCASDPHLPFRRFAAELFGFIDSHNVSSVVLDLRFNGGGDAGVLDPLKEGLHQRAGLANHVYLLIGPGTFSAAKDETLLLRQGLRTYPGLAVLRAPAFSQAELAAPPTGALLVGEPPGEKLNQYGNVRSVRLPHSGISVAYSTRFLQWVKDGNPLVLPPDLPAPLTLSDAIAGRDVALEAALDRIESLRH
jgi:hypothetical protein